MLHEIILSLLGFTGNIIVRNKENTAFEVNNKNQHQHHCEDSDECSSASADISVQEQSNSYGEVFDLLTEAEQVSTCHSK